MRMILRSMAQSRLIEGRWLAAPLIRQRISDGTLSFSPDASREEMERLVFGLNEALRKEKHSRVMDIAVNETLSRTIITAFTVFLTALALFIWGGEVLRDFSFAMLVGTVFGTYSSVYVASALALDVWIRIDRSKGVQAE